MGYIKIDRKILYHPALQKRGQELCERGAFLWLLLEASFVDRIYNIKGQTIHLKRGQLCASHIYMAEAWGWDKSKVQRFLERLKNFDTVSTDAPTDAPNDTPNVLTICHYDDYQDTPNDAPNDNKNNKGNNKGKNIVDTAFEEWWKKFRYVGKNKGDKKKALTFFKKHMKDEELLAKIVSTYNDWSHDQLSKSLSVPMVNTWLNNNRWENYNMTPETSPIVSMHDNEARLKNLSSWVTCDPPRKITSVISDDDVKTMLEKKIIEQHHYDRWING